MIVAWMVWSSGLERWEQIHPSVEDVFNFKKQHVKSVNGRELTVYLDPLGRLIGSLHANQPEWSIVEIPKPDLDDEARLITSLTEKIAFEIDKDILA